MEHISDGKRIRILVHFAIMLGLVFLCSLSARPALLLADDATSVAEGTQAPAGLNDFSFDPAGGQPDSLSSFDLTGEPGETLVRKAVLANRSNRPLVVHLLALDGQTGQNGGLTFPQSDTRPTAAGAWIQLDAPTRQLQPGETTEVEFEVRIPADAQPGEHYAGVVAWVQQEDDASRTSSTTAADDRSAKVVLDVQLRRALEVVVTCPGAAEARLAVDGVEAGATGNGMMLYVNIANAGQKAVPAKGEIQVEPGGFRTQLSLLDILPGTGVKHPILWSGSPSPGIYQTSVILSYPGGQRTEWHGTVEIGAGEMQDFANRAIPPSGSPRAPGIPVLLLVAAALLLVDLLLFVYYLGGCRRKMRSA